MKYLLLSLPLALMACVKPDCVVYVNGKPVYNQCYHPNDSDKSDRPAPEYHDDDEGSDSTEGNNGNKSNDHSDDSNGDNSDEGDE